MTVPLHPPPSPTPPTSSPPPAGPTALPAGDGLAPLLLPPVSRPSRRPPRRRWGRRLLALAAVVAALGFGWRWWFRPDVGPPVRVTGLVARGELPIAVTER